MFFCDVNLKLLFRKKKEEERMQEKRIDFSSNAHENLFIF